MTIDPFQLISANNVPCTRKEFYNQRDDRTLRVSNSNDYRNARVLITSNSVSTYSKQLSLLTAVNTISRFSTDIDVVIPDSEIHTDIQSKRNSLRKQCRREMEAADPFGNFNFSDHPSEEVYDASLIIGEGHATAESVVRIDSAGWLARIAKNATIDGFETQPRNPVGPGVAASFGAAEVFKAITGVRSDDSTQYTFDAYNLRHHSGFKCYQDYPKPPSCIELGNIQIIGAGAVSSATLYFLRHIPIRDTLTVVDPDEVEISNLNRTPLFTAFDGVKGTPKVNVVDRFMAESIKTQTYQQWYDEFIEEAQPFKPDIVLPLANERQVRSVIQNNFPPVMVHTTTGDWEVDVRRSIPTVDACLRCHFPPNSNEFSTICGEGVINTVGAEGNTEESSQGALPFISPLAGALLTGELIKLTFDDYPITREHAKIGVRNPTAFSGTWEQRDDCGFCNNTDDQMYRRLISDTKFSKLSIDL